MSGNVGFGKISETFKTHENIQNLASNFCVTSVAVFVLAQLMLNTVRQFV